MKRSKMLFDNHEDPNAAASAADLPTERIRADVHRTWARTLDALRKRRRAAKKGP